MVNFTKTSVATQKPVDKTVYELSGQFTYSFTTSSAGGSYSIASPEPGIIFLPDSIFSIDNGVTWFSDLDGNVASAFGPVRPELNTICTSSNIIFRWASFNVNSTFTVLFRTKLLAVN